MLRLLATLLVIGGISSQTPASDVIALTNANVVNVTDGSVQRSVTVVLRGGRIESVGAAAAPANAKSFDVRGRYIVPGLIDAHVHIDNFRAMRTALDSGVTTARSAGVAHYSDVGLRELVKQGALAGPDLVASGYHVRTFIAEQAFMDHPNLSDLMRGVTTRRRSGESSTRICRGVWTGSRSTPRSVPERRTPIRASRCSPRPICV